MLRIEFPDEIDLHSFIYTDFQIINGSQFPGLILKNFN